MALVGIVMGSDSDMPVMKKAAEVLDELGVSYDVRIISAHREPDVFFEYAKGAEAAGMKVIIAGAGMCTGGRIKYHLISNITRKECRIMFVGYQAKETLGRRYSRCDCCDRRSQERGNSGGQNACHLG